MAPYHRKGEHAIRQARHHRKPSYTLCKSCYFRVLTEIFIDSRVAALQELGFVFVADEAEWERWYNELKRGGGDAHPLPLASGDNLLLTNW